MMDDIFLQKELIREVEMGPFKHTVDDGLDIRKVKLFTEYVMSLCSYYCNFVLQLTFAFWMIPLNYIMEQFARRLFSLNF